VKGYELAAAQLHEAGLGTIFGLMGDANLDLLACAIERHGTRYFAARHESGAVAMADGYSRATGEIGVASVTSGPGFTNALTALTTAVRNGSRLLLVTGQIPLSQFSRNQRIDQFALTGPTGAGFVQVATRGELPGCVDRALALIESTRRPVVLNFLTPVLDGPAPEAIAGTPERNPGARAAAVPSADPAPDPDTLMAFAERLGKARRPVILVGRGAVDSGALPLLQELAERIGAVLVTTLCAKGAYEGHPSHFGLSGGFSHAGTVEVLERADLVAAFGASLNAWTTMAGKIFGDASLLQCDLDLLAFDRSTVAPVVRLLADARRAAQALLEAVPKAGSALRGPVAPWWKTTEGPAEGRAAEHDGTADLRAQGESALSPSRVDPRRLCLELDRLLPLERVVAVDGGHFFEFPSRYMRAPDQHGFLYTLSFGSIGLALPMGIGAAAGRPDRRTIVFVGDGGLLMSLPELETVARLRLPLTIVAMNDGAYGAEIKHLEDRGWSRSLAEFETPDLAGLARALGMAGISIRSVEDLHAQSDAILGTPGPILLDAHIDLEVDAEWVSLLKTIRGG
jgi:thiamine pyrophosphate-dependent acetolactate synthase large subunit-like protein